MVHRVHHRRQRCSMSHRRAAPADMEHLRRCRRRWILLGVMRVLMGGNRGEFFTERHIPKPCVRPRARLGGRPVLHAWRRCALGYRSALLRRSFARGVPRKPRRLDNAKRPDSRAPAKYAHLHAHCSRGNALCGRPRCYSRKHRPRRNRNRDGDHQREREHRRACRRHHRTGGMAYFAKPRDIHWSAARFRARYCRHHASQHRSPRPCPNLARRHTLLMATSLHNYVRPARQRLKTRRDKPRAHIPRRMVHLKRRLCIQGLSLDNRSAPYT